MRAMPKTAPIRILGLAVVAVVTVARAEQLEAATLTIDAPEGCVDLATLQEDVAALIGRPLGDVADADFHLVLARVPTPRERWHLKLEAREREQRSQDAPVIHVRELDARNCDELAEAAALAVAVSVRALDASVNATLPAASRDPLAHQQGNSAPSVGVATARAPGFAIAPAQPDWRGLLTVAMTGDAGELPGTGLGLRAGGGLARGALRGALTVGWLPPRDSLMSTGSGGRFQLAFAALDACIAPQRGRWTFLGCVGGEVGAYGAEGVGVARPSSRMAFWRAGRAAVGATLDLGGPVAFSLELGAIVPLSRPAFVLDGTLPVYRPAPVAARLSVGLEYWF